MFSPQLSMILTCLQNSNSNRKRIISDILLENGDNGRKQIDAAVVQLSSFSIDRYINIDLGNMTFTRNYCDSKINTERKENAIASSLIRGSSQCIILYFDFASNRDINNVRFEYIDTTIFSEEQKLYFEQKASALTEKRVAEASTIRKIGRNELCPCGSGKKYKRCCLSK